MLKMQVLALVLLLCAVAQGKVYQRCDWAQLLKNRGMDGYRGISLGEWVCLTEHESNHNTGVTNKNTDGSTDYGIFQINSKYWCDDGGVSVANGCGIQCTALLNDDPTVAIDCVKRVVRDTLGIKAWRAWTCHCQGQNLTMYRCGL